LKKKILTNINKTKFKVGLSLFFLLTIFAWLLIIPLSYHSEGSLKNRFIFGITDLFNNISSINIYFLFIAIILIFLQLFFSIKRIQFIAKAQNIKLSFRNAFHFTIGGLFLAAITPMQSGGIPFQTYILKRSGSNLAKSLAIISFRGILSGLFLVIMMPVIFFKIGDIFKDNRILGGLSKYLIVLYSLIIIFTFFSTIKNRMTHRFFLRLSLCIKNSKIKKITQKIINKFFFGIRDFLKSYKIFFTSGIKYTFLAIFTALLEMSIFFSIPPILALGLKSDSSITGVFITGIILTYLLAFTPTPGASGVAEVSGMSFSLIWSGPTTALIFLWRFVTSYIPALLGGIDLLFFIKSWRSDK